MLLLIPNLPQRLHRVFNAHLRLFEACHTSKRYQRRRKLHLSDILFVPKNEADMKATKNHIAVEYYSFWEIVFVTFLIGLCEIDCPERSIMVFRLEFSTTT